jgi:NADH-quinone oxidoreductase subunit F
MPVTDPVLVKRIPTFPWGDPKDRHIVGYDEYVKTGGYQALRKALTMKPEAVVDLIKESQLRGRGGAGFPCGLKWTFLPAPDGGRRYLAVNCDEAEPGTFKDRLLIDFDPHLVLEGIAITCYACRLDTAYFFIRGEYRHQAKVVENAIKEAYAHGIFGGPLSKFAGGTTKKTTTKKKTTAKKTTTKKTTAKAASASTDGGNDLTVECYLHRSAGAYICGEETGLLESVEGKRAWPRIKPPFPAVKGLFGRPTIVNNVETLSAVGPIVEHGLDWWKSMGCESSIGAPPSFGSKLMGVSGHVNRPGCYEVDLGIPLRKLVDEYCLGMRGGKRFKGAIAGGVSMGILGPDQFDAEMDFDIGRKYEVMGLGTGCPTVFDEDTDMVAVARNIARFFSNESCGQCTPCREGTRWTYQILCRIEAGDATSKDLDLLPWASCPGRPSAVSPTATTGRSARSSTSSATSSRPA